MKKLFVQLCMVLGLAGCSGEVDPRFVPVEGFDLERYLGTWYEIARFDHSFERGLVKVTAEYYLREDGMIRVLNRGYDPIRDKWKEAEGKAKFKGDENTGWLQVSFFGPFYADYIIHELEEDDYSYALVSGPNTSYLWILSRTPVMDEETVGRLKQKAESLGFDTEKMIPVPQDS